MRGRGGRVPCPCSPTAHLVPAASSPLFAGLNRGCLFACVPLLAIAQVLNDGDLVILSREKVVI